MFIKLVFLFSLFSINTFVSIESISIIRGSSVDGGGNGGLNSQKILYARIGELVNITCNQNQHQKVHYMNGDGDSDGEYNIDWYFLDKHGKMKIISYGNKTSSNLKYKAYLAAPPTQSDNTNRNDAVATTTKNKAYYLSALIESHDDEGIYKCINPDIPNFILDNIMVYIRRNSSNQLLQHQHYLLILMLVAIFLMGVY